MTNFLHYFRMGIEHILSIGAHDHLLFLSVLLIYFSISDWRALLGIFAAFTIGQVCSLIIVLLDFVQIPRELVERIIPYTILVAVIYMVRARVRKPQHLRDLAAFYGLIHGFAFAASILPMLKMRKSSNPEGMWKILLGFNLGVEVAHIFYGLVWVGLLSLLQRFTKIDMQRLRYVIFGLVTILAIRLILIEFL